EPTCIGCSNCANRCPWGNIVMFETDEKRPDGKAVEVATKCDLCIGRAEGPACVQMCPHGSAQRISFKDMERGTATPKERKRPARARRTGPDPEGAQEPAADGDRVLRVRGALLRRLLARVLEPEAGLRPRLRHLRLARLPVRDAVPLAPAEGLAARERA